MKCLCDPDIIESAARVTAAVFGICFTLRGDLRVFMRIYTIFLYSAGLRRTMGEHTFLVLVKT